jgi:GT2 family glycosyltransferase
MRASVIVCTVGRKSFFNCLHSLKYQDYDNYEILIVSFEKSIEKKVKELGATFILSPKANVSFQRNLGILKSDGDFICFIDDDAIADTSWISNLVKSFTDEKIACVGGKIKPKLEGKIPDALKSLEEKTLKGFLGETFLGDERKELQEPLVWGSNICFRREIFDEVGYFDEKIGRTPNLMLCNEDIEIQERILKKGLKIVYEPKAVVWHIIPKEKLTINYFLERGFWQGYSDVLASRRNDSIKKSIKKLKNPFYNFLMKEKIFENIFNIFLTSNLNEKILTYQKIGRIVGFFELMGEM